MIRNITAGPGIYVSGNGYFSPHIDMNIPDAGRVRVFLCRAGHRGDVMDSHLWAFFGGTVVGAMGVFAALWFDISIDKLSAWINHKRE
jgi:hypothetical protein